jgi:hypothetical protein
VSTESSLRSAIIAIDVARDTRVGPTWVRDKPAAHTVRICAEDLVEAKRIGRRLRAEHAAAGGGPVALLVLVDIEIHIAPLSRQARSEIAAATPPRPKSMRYVGTPAGLVGLVADIHAAGVADGVTLVPILVADVDLVLADLVTGATALAERRFNVLAAGSPVPAAH